LGDDHFACGVRVDELPRDNGRSDHADDKTLVVIEFPVDPHDDARRFLSSWDELCAEAVRLAHEVAKHYANIALSVDEDGLLQHLLSPRTQIADSFDVRLSRVAHLFKSIRAELPTTALGVALCTEELCPGGLDPLAGLNAALAFESAGAQFIIASGGTRDFPALKWRRPTRQKRREHDALDTPDTYISAELFLQSGLWLLERLKIPVWAHGEVSDSAGAAQIARRLGYSGILTSKPQN